MKQSSSLLEGLYSSLVSGSFERLANGSSRKNTDYGSEMKAASGLVSHTVYLLLRIAGNKVTL
jgi:hypothetical protein